VPGPRSNAQAIAELDLGHETLQKIFYKNALHVYERMGAGKLRTIDID
jgi:hypothetical protein